MTKTPNFDAKLDQILNVFLPHSRECASCKKLFQINEADIEFLKLLRVPLPKNCPECRMRDRMTYSTATLKFYRKDCAAHDGEKVISLFAPENPVKVYDNNYWWNPDAWDARDFGLPYDSSKVFFDQFRELIYRVPHFAIARYQSRMINSDYTSHSYDCKNCYFSTMIFYCELCLYCAWTLASKECIDCSEIEACEHCAHMLLVDRSYNCIYLQNCADCIDCAFCYNTYNSHHCFMSSNLRNASYVWYGGRLSKEEYERRRGEVDLGKRSVFEQCEGEYREMYKSTIHRATRNIQIVNSRGERLHNCKDCLECYFINDSEHNRYIETGIDIKDSMDLEAVGPNVVKSYQVCETQESYGVKFGYFINASREVEYCYECSDCNNCFGCIGLRKKSFCILNYQCTEDEYWKLLDEVKTKLLETGEYGEFFPRSCRIYPYNDTFAMVQFEVAKEQAIKEGFSWRDETGEGFEAKVEVLESNNLPDSILEVKDDITTKVMRCKKSGRLFRITPNELELYRKTGVPLPTIHPYERLMHRFHRKLPFTLFRYPCAKCKNETDTPFDPSLDLTVYCEACYQKAFS